MPESSGIHKVSHRGVTRHARHPLRRRAGFSLVELLVALFILAPGLIALLTLFPFGAVRMGLALRDDRSQQCALQDDGQTRRFWREGVFRALELNLHVEPSDAMYTTLDDADGSGPLPAIPATSRSASYPHLFDPLGYASYPSKRDRWRKGPGDLP